MNTFFSFLCKILLKPIVYLFFIKEAQGEKNIPRGNFILASNHVSHLDWIISGFVCVPRRFTYIGQIDNYKGLLGFARDLLYSFAEVIPVNRLDNESKREAVGKAIEAIKRGYILIIYPEGTRSRTGEIQKGKKGTAMIFLETGVPILPLGIKGTFELMPPGGKLKVKKTAKLNIGKPMYFKEELGRVKNLNPDSEEYNEIVNRITEKVMAEIARLKSGL